MRQRSWFIAAGGFLSLLLTSSLALAAPHVHLNWGSQINQSQCPSGPLVINVTQKVLNDVDSGICGNNWAFDDFVRQIKVVQTGSNLFCATVKYEGHFTTIAGSSPGGSSACSSTALGDGVTGTFEGGYISTIFGGTLLSSPAARTKGNIGTFDYNCDENGNCPGYVSWTTLYFSSTSGFDYAWWGWVYHAGNNGSWVNAVTGNSGDITGN